MRRMDLFYWALLQKRPIILRSVLIVATPCLEKTRRYQEKTGRFEHETRGYPDIICKISTPDT